MDAPKDDVAEDQPQRTNWPAITLVPVLIVIWFVGVAFVSCLCRVGSVKAAGVTLGIALIYGRLLVALFRREQSRLWILYLILAVLLAPLMEVLAFAFEQH